MNLNCTLETKTNQALGGARQSDKHEIIFTFLSIALKYTKEQLRLIKDIQSLVQFELTGCTVSRSYSLTRGKGLFCISREMIDSEPAGEYKFIYIFFGFKRHYHHFQTTHETRVPRHVSVPIFSVPLLKTMLQSDWSTR